MAIRLGSVTTEALTDGDRLRVGGAQVESLSRSGKTRVAATAVRTLSTSKLRRVSALRVEALVIEKPPPNAPTSLMVDDITSEGASFRWYASLDGEPTLSFEYSLDNGDPVNNGLVASKTIAGLSPNTTHTFKVRSVGETKTSEWTSVSFTTTVGAPAAPVSLSITNIKNSTATANWGWTQGSGPAALGFEFEIVGSGSITWTAYPATTWDLLGLSSNTDYSFRVRAVGQYGSSAWVEIPFRTEGPPVAPSSLSVTNIAGTTAKLSWTASPTATGYRYRIDGGSSVDIPVGTETNLSGLVPEKQQTLELQAYNTYGSSPWVPVQFTTLVAVPNSPQGLRISSSTSTSITAVWFPPDSGSAATSYQYSLDSGPWIDIAGGSTSLSIDGFAPGSNHNLRIRSKNAVGTSVGSASLDFQLILGPPNPPADLTAYQITKNEATVKWSPWVSGPPVVRYEYSFDYSAVADAELARVIFFENLETESKHSFRVRAVGEYATSAWSEVLFETEKSDIPIPDSLRLSWNEAGKKEYENGIDRGVLYLSNGEGVAWNGLVSLEEDLSDEGSEPLYFDGEKYLDAMTMGDFSGSLRAITYPDEFMAYEGYVELGTGVYADDQNVDIFGLSFRSMLGNDTMGDEYGYRLHLVYNLTAVPDSRSHQTIGSNTALTEFGWTIQSVPENVPGYRPTAHVIIDSRYMNKYILRGIEALLYGSDLGYAHLPSIAELIDYVKNFVFIKIVDNEDGTWTATGPDEAIEMTSETSFVIHDANAQYLDADTFVIESS